MKLHEILEKAKGMVASLPAKLKDNQDKGYGNLEGLEKVIKKEEGKK